MIISAALILAPAIKAEASYIPLKIGLSPGPNPYFQPLAVGLAGSSLNFFTVFTYSSECSIIKSFSVAISGAIISILGWDIRPSSLNNL